MTFPSVERLRLILVASLSLCPVAPVLDWRSDPAKSTRFSFPIFTRCWPSGPLSLNSIITVNIAWDLRNWRNDVNVVVFILDDHQCCSWYPIQIIFRVFRCVRPQHSPWRMFIHICSTDRSVLVADRHDSIHVVRIVGSEMREIFDVDPHVRPLLYIQPRVLIFSQ